MNDEKSELFWAENFQDPGSGDIIKGTFWIHREAPENFFIKAILTKNCY